MKSACCSLGAVSVKRGDGIGGGGGRSGGGEVGERENMIDEIGSHARLRCDLSFSV